jgi:hypothetical protein
LVVEALGVTPWFERIGLVGTVTAVCGRPNAPSFWSASIHINEQATALEDFPA